MTEEPPVQVTLRGAVAHLVINRPEVKNSLNVRVLSGLADAIEKIAGTPGCRVVFLYGAGTESFCAGADLKELAALRSVEERTAFFARVAAVVSGLNRLPQPVVAKVHGFALAGGCGLVAASDIVLAAEDAVFGLPEINIGLVPMVVMAPLSRILSRRVLTQLVLTGERMNAPRALNVGLVTEVHPKERLDAEADRMVSLLEAKSGAALAAAKRALYDVPENDYFPLFDELPGRIGQLSDGDDAREGVSAFLQKRAPRWKNT